MASTPWPTGCHREKGSIHAILVANPATRLYTHPLEWTAEHLQHLSCELHPMPPPLSPGCKTANEAIHMGRKLVLHGIEWGNLLADVDVLQSCRSRCARDERMRELVAKLCRAATGQPVQSGSLPFLYLSRPVAQLRLPFLFHNQRAAWAYVDIAWCSNQRMRFYRHRRRRSYSYATQAITNSNGLPFDPFYTATLIALAQKARSIHRGNEPLKVSLFVADHKQDDLVQRPRLTTFLHQYTATIPQSYLQKFDDPYHFSNSTLHIQQQQIPLSLCHLSTLYEAIQRSSGVDKHVTGAGAQELFGPPASTPTKKRKLLEDITGVTNEVPRVIRQRKGT